jgi:hypothetical protein
MDLNRRQFLEKSGLGLGSIALSSLLGRGTAQAGEYPSDAGLHHPARAKNVIFLHMTGGPSQVDLFDHKPILQKLDGQLAPAELVEGQRFAFLKGHPKLIGSPYRFKRHGQCGMEFSDRLPHMAKIADRFTRIRSLHTDEFNHGPAQLVMHTGFPRFGRPSFGSWVSYGLGSENDDLPAYVVMVSGAVPGGGSALWSSGFLPSQYHGTELRSEGDPVLYLSDPPGLGREGRRRILDAIRDLNQEQYGHVGDPEIQSRISQYELAYRMQTSVPELTDLSKEPRAVLEAYGAKPGDGTFAGNCLLARRLVERGVRFVELFDADWDHHTMLYSQLPKKCEDVDRPVAALILDLEERGLLDETLVIFAGEFGRTPMVQTDVGNGETQAPGRDHHRDAFTVLLAGGGMKPGLIYGDTDEFGYHVTENPVHVHDLQATMLHLLGVDHKRLTHRFMGREFRLTDVAGKVVSELMS